MLRRVVNIIFKLFKPNFLRTVSHYSHENLNKKIALIRET